MQIRDRITELRRVPASELIPNPKNWRVHPENQQDGLRSVLERVGYADAVIARETDEGLVLIDGHLRAETTPDALIPVLITDLDEAEADEVLATLDPLASLAEPDIGKLTDLLKSVQDRDEAVEVLFQDIGDVYGINMATLLEQETLAAYVEPDEGLLRSGGPTDNMKALVLHFSPEAHEQFMQMAFDVGNAHGIDTLADVVFAAVKNMAPTDDAAD
jgi:hypothetical protein